MLVVITKCGAVSDCTAWVEPPSCFFDDSCPFSDRCKPGFDGDDMFFYAGY